MRPAALFLIFIVVAALGAPNHKCCGAQEFGQRPHTLKAQDNLVDYENRPVSQEFWSVMNGRLSPTAEVPWDWKYKFDEKYYHRPEIGYYGLADHFISSEYVALPNDTAITGDFTIFAVFRLDSIDSWDKIVMKPYSQTTYADPYNDFELTVVPPSNPSHPGQLLFKVTATDGTAYWIYGPRLSVGCWYKVIAKLQDGMLILRVMNSTYDGTVTGGGPTSVHSSGSRIYIGGNPFAGWEAEGMDGQIDVIIIWNRGLDSEEIEFLKNVVFYWDGRKEFFRSKFSYQWLGFQNNRYIWTPEGKWRPEDVYRDRTGAKYTFTWHNVTTGLLANAHLYAVFEYTDLYTGKKHTGIIDWYVYDGANEIYLGTGNITVPMDDLAAFINKAGGDLIIKAYGQPVAGTQVLSGTIYYDIYLQGSAELERSFSGPLTAAVLQDKPADVEVTLPNASLEIDFNAYSTQLQVNGKTLNYTYSPYFILRQDGAAEYYDQVRKLTFQVCPCNGVEMLLSTEIVVMRGLWNLEDLIAFVEDANSLTYFDPLGRVAGTNTYIVPTRDIYIYNNLDEYATVTLEDRAGSKLSVVVAPHTQRRLSLIVSEICVNGKWVYLNRDYTVYLSEPPRAQVRISLYNEFTGLGVPEEMFKVYVNGTRIPSGEFYVPLGSKINVTVMDYWDRVIHSQIYEIDEEVEYLDIGIPLGRLYIYNDMDVNLNLNVTCLNASRDKVLTLVVFKHTGVVLDLPAGTYNLTFWFTENYTIKRVRISSYLVQVVMEQNESGELVEVNPPEIRLVREDFQTEEEKEQELAWWAAKAFVWGAVSAIAAYIVWTVVSVRRKKQRVTVYQVKLI